MILTAWLLAASGASAATYVDSAARTTLPTDVLGQIAATDYRVLPVKDIPAKRVVGKDPTLRTQMDALALKNSKRDYRDYKKPPPKREIDVRHWVPNWMGITGGLELPWAYTIPTGQWAAGFNASHRSVGPTYWPLVYKRITGDDLGLTLGYGVRKGVEVTADLTREDRAFVYAQQIDTVTGALDPGAVFTGDRTLAGVGAKATAMCENLQFAVGFHATSFRNLDRNVIEFHDYDRMNNLYGVLSAKKGDALEGHLAVRYVTYDWVGGIFPSGATVAAPGGPASSNGVFADPKYSRRGFGPGHQRHGYPVFQVTDPTSRLNGQLIQDPPANLQVQQVGVGRNNWFNIGLGFDFEAARDLLLIGELSTESGITFVSDTTPNNLETWFVSLGARYTRNPWSATLGIRHINTREYREPELSVAYKF